MRSHGRYVSNTKQKRVISGSIQGVDGYILKAWETCLKGGCLLLFFLPTTGTLCIVSRAKTYHMPRHITCQDISHATLITGAAPGIYVSGILFHGTIGERESAESCSAIINEKPYLNIHYVYVRKTML